MAELAQPWPRQAGLKWAEPKWMPWGGHSGGPPPQWPTPCHPVCTQLTFLEGAPADLLGGRPGSAAAVTGTTAALRYRRTPGWLFRDSWISTVQVAGIVRGAQTERKNRKKQKKTKTDKKIKIKRANSYFLRKKDIYICNFILKSYLS